MTWPTNQKYLHFDERHLGVPPCPQRYASWWRRCCTSARCSLRPRATRAPSPRPSRSRPSPRCWASRRPSSKRSGELAGWRAIARLSCPRHKAHAFPPRAAQCMTVRVRAAKGEIIESPLSAESAAYARDALAKVSPPRRLLFFFTWGPGCRRCTTARLRGWWARSTRRWRRLPPPPPRAHRSRRCWASSIFTALRSSPPMGAIIFSFLLFVSVRRAYPPRPLHLHRFTQL